MFIRGLLPRNQDLLHSLVSGLTDICLLVRLREKKPDFVPRCFFQVVKILSAAAGKVYCADEVISGSPLSNS